MDGPRPIKPEEFDSLSQLLDATFSGWPKGIRTSFPLLFDYRNAPNLWVFVDDGRVVSHAGVRIDEAVIFGCRLKIASVGSVATYDEYRGRGLASALLSAAEVKAVHEGASIMSISGSRGLYGRFGAVKVGKAVHYDVPAGDAAEKLFVQEATPEDIFRLERLYEQEPVRLHRPLEDWRAAMEALADASERMRGAIFLFGDAEAATGYVMVRYGNWGSGAYAVVAEYAGSRPHLLGALPAAAAAIGREKLLLRAPEHDWLLKRAASATGLQGRVDFANSHTVKISSLETFARGLKPYFEERLGRSGAGGVAFQPGQGGTYDVIIGEEHEPFAVPAFTALAFGTPERDDLEGVGFGGGLLGRIFPVPLPLPGLNYV